MSEYTIEIPEELETYITKVEGFNSVDGFIETVLIRPLMKKLEHQEEQKELAKVRTEITQNIKRTKDKVRIKRKAKKGE